MQKYQELKFSLAINKEGVAYLKEVVSTIWLWKEREMDTEALVSTKSATEHRISNLQQFPLIINNSWV